MGAKKFQKKLKFPLDNPGSLCYNEYRKQERGANQMTIEYFEIHQAEWEAMQEYLQNPED